MVLANMCAHALPYSYPSSPAAKRNNVDNKLASMTDTMLTPEEIVQVMEEGLAEDNFYILGFDDTLPREVVLEQLRIRVDDMVRASTPLSHMHPDKSIRDQSRPRLRDALARGRKAMAGYDVRSSAPPGKKGEGRARL